MIDRDLAAEIVAMAWTTTMTDRSMAGRGDRRLPAFAGKPTPARHFRFHRRIFLVGIARAAAHLDKQSLE